MIKRGQLRLSQALSDREHGGIDEADVQVYVRGEQFIYTPVVRALEVFYLEGATSDLLEHCGKATVRGVPA